MLERHEEQISLWAEVSDRLMTRVGRLEGTMLLSPECQGELSGWMQAMAQHVGQPVRVIEQELAAAMKVEEIGQLTEAAWGEVVAWLRERMGR